MARPLETPLPSRDVDSFPDSTKAGRTGRCERRRRLVVARRRPSRYHESATSEWAASRADAARRSNPAGCPADTPREPSLSGTSPTQVRGFAIMTRWTFPAKRGIALLALLAGLSFLTVRAPAEPVPGKTD